MAGSRSQSSDAPDGFNSQGAGRVLYQENGSDGWQGWSFDPKPSQWPPTWEVSTDGQLRHSGSSMYRGYAFAPYNLDSAILPFAIEAEMEFSGDMNFPDRKGFVDTPASGGMSSAGIACGGSWGFEHGYAAGVFYDRHDKFLGITVYRDDIVELAKKVFRPGTAWHTYRLEFRENTLRVLIDGAIALQAVDVKHISHCPKVGLWCYGTGGSGIGGLE